MDKKIILAGTVLVLASVSIPIIIHSLSNDAHYTLDIDPRITQIMPEFAISSNIDIYSIRVEDEINGMAITTSSTPGGFIHINDPLPILQKLFPAKNIVSFKILVDSTELPYTVEDKRLQIQVNSGNLILIVGFDV